MKFSIFQQMTGRVSGLASAAFILGCAFLPESSLLGQEEENQFYARGTSI